MVKNLVQLVLGIHSNEFFEIFHDYMPLEVSKGENSEYLEKTPTFLPSWEVFCL